MNNFRNRKELDTDAVYAVECPKCGNIQGWSPRKKRSKRKRYFKCKRCEKRRRVGKIVRMR